MRWSSCSTACAAFVLLTACAAGGGDPDVASPTSTAPPATPTATPTATPSSTPSPTAPPAAEPTQTSTTPPADGTAGCGEVDSYESSATCLYEAFRAQDREAASRHATPEAIEPLFALGGYPTDDQWTLEGCGPGRETSPSSGVACHYLIPGEVHPVHVELAMRDDFVVEQVLSIG